MKKYLWIVLKLSSLALGSLVGVAAFSATNVNGEFDCNAQLKVQPQKNLKIREARATDASLIAEFIHARRAEMGLYSKVGADGRPITADLDHLEEVYGQDNGKILILFSGDFLIGTAAFVRKDQATCELKKIYVDPRSRGQGIGEMLIRTALSQARAIACPHVTLQTRPEMEAAVRLYEKLGFVKDVTQSTDAVLIYTMNLN